MTPSPSPSSCLVSSECLVVLGMNGGDATAVIVGLLGALSDQVFSRPSRRGVGRLTRIRYGER